MNPNAGHLAALAKYLSERRPAILKQWRDALRADPALSATQAMPRSEVNDHIPALLSAFEHVLRAADGEADGAAGSEDGAAAAHGQHRWQQGYDLSEVTRELGRLNECLCAEIDRYALARPSVPAAALADARLCWARAYTVATSASTAQFFHLQRLEAASHVGELEQALSEVRELEAQRAALWQQAAHDLRGNVGAVANVTAGLALHGPTPAGDNFLRLLQHNVASLLQLLDDVTSLARLQAGQEQRQLAEVDAATLLRELCDGLQPLAQRRGLALRVEGPASWIVESDAVKLRRVAQNLVLNALAYTADGEVAVHWRDAGANDDKRWALLVRDTGPGLQPAAPAHQHAGEGIGLSIVRRLCELLDAQIEIETAPGRGTLFRVLFPRRFS